MELLLVLIYCTVTKIHVFRGVERRRNWDGVRINGLHSRNTNSFTVPILVLSFFLPLNAKSIARRIWNREKLKGQKMASLKQENRCCRDNIYSILLAFCRRETLTSKIFFRSLRKENK